MRGHWISTTRKLNRHYQSGTPNNFFKWDEMQVNADHVLAWGVDHIFFNDFSVKAPGVQGISNNVMPALKRAQTLEFIPYIRRENGSSGGVYLPAIRLHIGTEDAQGNVTDNILNWYCPSAQPSPSGQWIPYTALHQTAFTNLYNNSGLAPLYGERFNYNATEDRYRLTTQFVINLSSFQGAVKFSYFLLSTGGFIQSEALNSTQKVYWGAELKTS